MELTLFILEIIGTVAFAVSGLIAGVNRNMDILGITIMAVVTATGWSHTGYHLGNHAPYHVREAHLFDYRPSHLPDLLHRCRDLEKTRKD